MVIARAIIKIIYTGRRQICFTRPTAGISVLNCSPCTGGLSPLPAGLFLRLIRSEANV